MKRPQGEKFNIEKIWDNLKNLISCSEPGREEARRMLKKERLVTQKWRVEGDRNGGDSVLYQKTVNELLMRPIQICKKEESMEPRAAEKENELYEINRSYSSVLGARVYQNLL